MTNNRGWYLAAINRVDDHIDAHLAEPLDLETLAAVARFSPWPHARPRAVTARLDRAWCLGLLWPCLNQAATSLDRRGRDRPARTLRPPLTGAGCNSRERR